MESVSLNTAVGGLEQAVGTLKQMIARCAR
jgi:hypothetical protein